MNRNRVIKRINPLVLEAIAHRGYHNEDIDENSLGAFKRALEHNLAIELDVHLTKDNELVVFHDFTLERMTNKEGIIEELSLEEIKNNYSLNHGEKIPTLKEVLSLIDEKVPLVIELKVYKKNYKALARRVQEELKIIKDKRNIVIISFDPRALFKFKRKDYVRLLLVTTYKDYRYLYFFRHFFEGIDIEAEFLDEKKVRRYAKRHFVNIWTIEDKEKFLKYYQYADTVTFQFIDEKYIKEMYKLKK